MAVSLLVSFILHSSEEGSIARDVGEVDAETDSVTIRASYMLHSEFLFAFLFNPDDGGYMLLEVLADF
jgi:hypothetical protein